MSASPSEAASSAWPAMLTWRAHECDRMESTRVHLSGSRIKAYGRIVAAAATDAHPAFSASYNLVTDEAGATKRLSLSVTLSERDRQLSISRDDENMWSVVDHQGQSRGSFDGAMDVDMVFSPFFNALPIRRTGVYMGSESVTVPVVYVTLPEFAVNPATITYSNGSDGIKVHSPVAEATVTVDDDGFILDYPGLAERI